MSSTKKYEYRENKNYHRDTEGLKQRRLKDDSRWRFNPNETQDDVEMEDEEDLFGEFDNDPR